MAGCVPVGSVLTVGYLLLNHRGRDIIITGSRSSNLPM